MQIDFPLHIDGRGGFAHTTETEHVRDLIEQVLFTAPGERVNRPTFGCGLPDLVFEPNRDLLSGVTEATVSTALQGWLGDIIRVDSVAVENSESALRVDVAYTIRRTNQGRVDQFVRGL